MEIKARSDIGSRQTNEDSYLCLQKDDNNFLAFVCDGMGGHLGGSFASQSTIDVLNDAYSLLDIANEKLDIGVWLFETLQKANTLIYQKSIENDSLRGMGTTVTGIIMFNGTIYYAHVGDSRIYVYSKNDLQQITTDHTYVNSLLLNGLITYKQALKHPKRHILTNSLGIKKDASIDIGKITLNENENILICTDGLYNMLDNKKITKILSQQVSTDKHADDLVFKALEAGGTDNISLILLER